MHHYASAAFGWCTTVAAAASRVFFADFDGIVDAEMATGMNHDQVRQLIIDTATNRSATAGFSSSSPPPPASDSATAAAVITQAVVHHHLSPSPPPRQLRWNPQITMRLTYDARGTQVEMAEYKKDSD